MGQEGRTGWANRRSNPIGPSDSLIARQSFGSGIAFPRQPPREAGTRIPRTRQAKTTMVLVRGLFGLLHRAEFADKRPHPFQCGSPRQGPPAVILTVKPILRDAPPSATLAPSGVRLPADFQGTTHAAHAAQKVESKSRDFVTLEKIDLPEKMLVASRTLRHRVTLCGPRPIFAQTR